MTTTVKQVAAQVTVGLHSDADKVRALHRFVIEKTRYVGLEFGIHGYKPYPVEPGVVAPVRRLQGQGLAAGGAAARAGIESELVLLRSRRAGLVDSEPASLAIFDHAITYVPRSRPLPRRHRGVRGPRRVAQPGSGGDGPAGGIGGTTLARTPVLPASANRAARVWKVALAADGKRASR